MGGKTINSLPEEMLQGANEMMKFKTNLNSVMDSLIKQLPL